MEWTYLANKMGSFLKSKHWPIVTILFVAAILRVIGVWHDYPYSFYPDEAHFVKRALSFGSLDFNPHWFHKPAFYMYLLFFEYGVFFLIGKVAGSWITVSDFAVQFVKNPGPFYLIGRMTTVIFSLGSIVVVYRLGERHFREGAGTIAALLLTLSYGHVAASQDIKADIPAMFFAITSMFFLLNYLQENRLRDLVLTAALAGIGTATKKYPIVMLVPIVISVVIVHRDIIKDINIQIRSIVFYIGIVLLVFYTAYFICSPYNFLDPMGRRSTFGFFLGLPKKIYQLFGDVEVKHPGDFIDQRTSLLRGYISYFRVLVATKGMGAIISGFAVPGIIYLLFQFNRQAFLFLLYPILFVLISVFTFPGYTEPRHQLAIYPFLAISGGALVVAVVGSIRGNKKIVYTLLFISLLYPAYRIVERDLYLSLPNTRNLAKTWIEANISKGTKLLIDENGPQLLQSKKQLEKSFRKASEADPKGQFTAHYSAYLKHQILAAKDAITYDIDIIRLPWWKEKEEQTGVYFATTDYDKDMGNPLKPVGVMPYKFYKENGYAYIIVSSSKYKGFFKEGSVKPKNFPSFYRFYKTLFDEGILVKEFQPDTENRRGPVIKIFKTT